MTSPSVPRAPTMTCMRSGPVALRGASRVAISVPSGSSAWMPTHDCTKRPTRGEASDGRGAPSRAPSVRMRDQAGSCAQRQAALAQLPLEHLEGDARLRRHQERGLVEVQDVAHARQVDVDAVVVAGTEADADTHTQLAGDAHHVAQLGGRARPHQRAARLRQHVLGADGVRQPIGPERRLFAHCRTLQVHQEQQVDPRAPRAWLTFARSRSLTAPSSPGS